MRRIDNEPGFALAKELTVKLRSVFTKRMKQLGYRQEDVARLMGKTRSNVAVLLTQDNVLSLPVIIGFCRALDLDFELVMKERMPSVSLRDSVNQEQVLSEKTG